MAATHALFETQALEQLTQIVKTDGRVGCTAQKASERFLRAHDDILHRMWQRPARLAIVCDAIDGKREHVIAGLN